MSTIHAFFSAGSALRSGSMVYRKPDGSTVNVTRMDVERDGRRGSGDGDGEVYVGEVVPVEDGGCFRPRIRVRGITD